MYTPDRWIVVEIDDNGEKHQRVFAGWYGGYLKGDSWRMNSGITVVDDCGDYYDFMGESGSVYRCYKNAYGMSMYMQSVLAGFMKQQTDTFKISIVESYDEEECLCEGGSD